MSQPAIRKYLRKETMRRALDAGAYLIIQAGGDFSSVTVRQIAVRAGRSTAAIFSNWLTKEDFVLAVASDSPDARTAMVRHTRRVLSKLENATPKSGD